VLVAHRARIVQTLNGYFVHFIAPDGLDQLRKDIVFAIDTSGSMQGRKIEQVKVSSLLLISIGKD
jgi:uncharacterized protein with von Willebrand factor type A (vWA) domain